MRDIIMMHVLDLCAFSSVMLAATCWDERRRYERLVSPENRTTYREYYIRFNDDEEGYWVGDGWVLRGEKGFEHAKKDQEECYRKIVRPYKRHAKERARRDTRRDHGHRDRLLKRGDYMDY